MTKKSEISTIKCVLNGKGGVGKGVVSRVITALSIDKYKHINLYEIDNNNKKGSVQSSIINHRVFQVLDSKIAIFDVSFDEGDNEILSIIDTGGSDDYKAVLETLYKNKVKNIDFYIPTLHDDETISNIQDTIQEIKKYFENPKITLILNKAKSVDFNEVKKQFINIFGSEKYNYKSNYESIVNNISSIAIIPETHLIYLMKNHYRIEMADLYLSSKDLNDNEATYRSKWKIEAKELNDKEHYHSKMELLGFGVELIDFIENCKKTLKL